MSDYTGGTREDGERELTGDETDASYLYLPSIRFGPALPHYYGDYVRKLFLGGAALIFILAPFFGNFLPFTLPFELIGAVALIAFGALTNPLKQWVVAGDAILSAVFLLGFEAIAYYAYMQGDMLMFFAREALAVVFLLSLYFSVKTLRAMMMHQIGKREPPGEFLEEEWKNTHKWM